MKINFVQILDFWGCGVEFLIGHYIHLGNKKHICLQQFWDLDYKMVLYESLLLVAFSLLSSIFMLTLFFFFEKTLYLLSLAAMLVVIIHLGFLGSLLLLPLYILYIFYMHKYRRLLQKIDISSIFKRNYFKLILYFLYSLIAMVFSSIVLQMVLKVDFVGIRMLLFMFFNVIVFFAFVKKTSANIILACMHEEGEFSIIAYVINRTLCIGTLCLSSLLSPVILILFGPTCDEYISYYSIIYNRSYFQSLRECKYLLDTSFRCLNCEKIPKESFFSNRMTNIFPLCRYSKKSNCICDHSYIRYLLYPYIICVTFLTSRYSFFPFSFFESYHRSTTIFYLHAKIIEIIFTLSQAKKFIDKIEKDV